MTMATVTSSDIDRQILLMMKMSGKNVHEIADSLNVSDDYVIAVVNAGRSYEQARQNAILRESPWAGDDD